VREALRPYDGDTPSGAKLENFAVEKDGGFPQGISQENKEAATQKVTKA
jgi:hypothetical protein